MDCGLIGSLALAIGGVFLTYWESRPQRQTPGVIESPVDSASPWQDVVAP